MKIALLGYGKMGKVIERIALERGHEIVLRKSSSTSYAGLENADVAIDFSLPTSAVANISECLNNRIPVKTHYAVVMPDYLTVTYSCTVFTYYVEQLNKIVEAIEYASDAYWGDPQSFQFRAMIDSFGFQNELVANDERMVRSTFNVKLNGYIIPDVLQRDLNTIIKYNDKAKIIFSVEATNNTGIFEGAIEGNRIITTDPVRLKDRATFVNNQEGGDVIGDISSTEAENRSTAIG
jgi:hypothetical protein